MQVVDDYPGDAAKGADFLTGAAQRIIVVDPAKSVAEGGTRKERVVITDLYLDHEGRVCLSETSVAHMANLLGMFEGSRVLAIVDANDALRAEVAAQQEMVAMLQNRIAGLETDRAIEYVGVDGKTYATIQGAVAATATPVMPVEAPAYTEAAGPVDEAPRRSAEDQAEITYLHQQIAVLEEKLSGGGASSPPEDGSTVPPPEPDPALSRRERRKAGR